MVNFKLKKCIPCFATQVSRILLDSTGTASADKIDYFDGLGRSSQTVLRKFSPGLKDIVTLREYDTAGRLSRSYLPRHGEAGIGQLLRRCPRIREAGL